MDTFGADLKQALRVLRQSPGFTATAIAVLALGIGANTAIFSVINAVLLMPLPYPDAGRIVILENTSPQGRGPSASVPKYNVWRRQTSVLEDVAAYNTGGPGINLSGSDRPEQVKGIHVSHEFFHLFGAPIALGRTFTVAEDSPHGGNFAVLSNGLWQRRFGSDPGVLGKTLSMGGEPFTIIGVVGKDFDFDTNPDLYLPFQADPNSTNQGHYFRVAARLKPGVTLAAANSAMQLAAQEFKRLYPQSLGPQNSFGVDFMQELLVANVRTALYVLLAAVVCVLMIACANVANLLLARAASRSREIAIRAAIGAGRARIIRQLLTESVLLSLLGGILGLAIGEVGVRVLLAVNPGHIPRIGANAAGIGADWRVLGFTFALALLTGIVFGLAPAIHASRADLAVTLKDAASRSGSGLRQNKTRGTLVIVEIALAMVLLVGAGLLIRTFAALHHVDPGFDPHNVLTMDTALTGVRYDKTAAVADVSRRVLERVQAIPGVEAAAATSYLPLEGGFGLGFIIQGRPLTNGPAHGGAGWNYVSAHFFDVFRVPVVAGRVFTDRDDALSPPVVVINQAMANQYWKNQSPLGQRLIIGSTMGRDFTQPPREIVGIVADARDGGLNNVPGPATFIPLAQVGDAYMALNNTFVPLNWVVRTRVDPYSVSAPIQKAFQDVADIPIAHVRSMDEIVANSTSSNQFNTLLLGVFAFFAILLASIGLYGLMAYSVQQRTLEFGIRVALGADQGRLRNLVIRQAMTLALIGIAIGVGAAYGLTRFLSTLLFDVKPTDPIIFGSVALLLAAVAALASYIPARRALRIDPMVALRYQ